MFSINLTPKSDCISNKNYFSLYFLLRFHKTTLPTVRRSTQRTRPWTVTEKTITARAAAALKNSKTKLSKSAGTYKSANFPVTTGSRAAVRSTGTLARRSVGGWREKAGDDDDDDDNGDDIDYEDEVDEYFYDENGGIRIRRRKARGPLLEVRPFLASGAEGEASPALGDQRSKLRGKDGCLHSRVKQCVRFVRYRERLDRQGDDRPLKAEAGRYRPMSKTDIADHRPPNPPPSPEQKMQRSVDAYRKYVDNIAMQTKYVASKSSPGKYQTPQPSLAFKNVLAPTSSRLQTRNKTNLAPGIQSSVVLDTDSIRSVMDSNLPDMADSPGIVNTTPGRQATSSAIYTKDANDVSQALAIRRISPKLSSNRIVAGTRGVVVQEQPLGSARREREETPHWATIDSDDGDDMFEGTPTNAIVVPQATKSECLSEYSGAVESTVVEKEDR
ncbi:hypothetical protein PoB_004181200 [Plakobranchus ocellatus]|uniref:Uncharacterized protein n=1 Tax=Plakobranchus ocellatus TaxID=259542 RepID=A0AAV4B723_9GAST|nr:hypothetical protein PoB_004181200 [Plakobranchus ocellatus]